MLRIIIRDLEGNDICGGSFETQELLDAWLAKQKSKTLHFGKFENETDYVEDIQDLTDEYNRKQEIKKRIDKGDAIKKLASDLHSLCVCHCRNNNLSGSQQLQLKTNQATILEMLKDGQALSVRPYIENLVPDGVLLTQEMKDDMLYCYSKFDEKCPDI